MKKTLVAVDLRYNAEEGSTVKYIVIGLLGLCLTWIVLVQAHRSLAASSEPVRVANSPYGLEQERTLDNIGQFAEAAESWKGHLNLS